MFFALTEFQGRTQSVPLSLSFECQSELTEFFAELTEFAAELSEFSPENGRFSLVLHCIF